MEKMLRVWLFISDFFEPHMEKAEFARLFHDASSACVAFARKFVIDGLPDETLYEVFPNSSYDGHAIHPGERVYPEDKLPQNEFHSMTAERVVDFLWREGLVPEWIDLTVVAANQQHTIIEVLCCGRFTANEALLYYNHVNRGPFGVKGPYLPHGYDPENPQPFALSNPRRIS